MAQRQTVNHSSYFAPITKLVQTRIEGYPNYTINQFFYAALGDTQIKIDYIKDQYYVKFRGFYNQTFFSSWTTYRETPFQKQAIASYISLILDKYDPLPQVFDYV